MPPPCGSSPTGSPPRGPTETVKRCGSCTARATSSLPPAPRNALGDALLLSGTDSDRQAVRGRLHAVRHAGIRRLALAILGATRQPRDNHKQIHAIVETFAPGLTSRPGICPVSAPPAIISVSDLTFRSGSGSSDPTVTRSHDDGVRRHAGTPPQQPSADWTQCHGTPARRDDRAALGGARPLTVPRPVARCLARSSSSRYR